MSNEIRTLSQKRAEHALEEVLKVKDEPSANDNTKREFVSCVKNLPATIMTNGLGQALAMLLSKSKNNNVNNKKDVHIWVYNALQSWLCGNEELSLFNSETKLIDGIIKYDRNTYIRAQAEALAWLEWYKKFAAAFIVRKEKEGGSSV